MPEQPEPSPSPTPIPVAPAPAPAPTPTPGAPPQAPPGPPGTSFAAALSKAFPDGVIPVAPMPVGLQTQAPQFNQPAPTPAMTGPTGVAEPVAATGATGAPTGPTGAATGPTGAASGPSGPPTAADLDAVEKKMTMEAGTAFRIIRTENKALEKQVEAERERADAAERKASETAVESKEVTDLRAKVEKYEQELAVTNFEATEQYQNTIGKPLQTAEANLTQLATKYEVPAGELRAALAEPDAGKRSDLLSELSAKFNRLDTVAFDRIVVDIASLQQQKEQAKSNAAHQLTLTQAQRQREAADQSKALEKDWASARDKAITDLTADTTAVGILFNPTGDEKFDADITKAIDQVKGLDISKLSNQEIAARFYRSEVLPLATKLISNQYAQIEALTEEVARLRGSTPPIGDGTPPTPTPANTVPPNATFADAARRAMDGVIPR